MQLLHSKLKTHPYFLQAHKVEDQFEAFLGYSGADLQDDNYMEPNKFVLDFP